MIYFLSYYNLIIIICNCINYLDLASCDPFNLNEEGTEVAGSLIHNCFKNMNCTYVIGGLIKVK